MPSPTATRAVDRKRPAFLTRLAATIGRVFSWILATPPVRLLAASCLTTARRSSLRRTRFAPLTVILVSLCVKEKRDTSPYLVFVFHRVLSLFATSDANIYKHAIHWRRVFTAVARGLFEFPHIRGNGHERRRHHTCFRTDLRPPLHHWIVRILLPTRRLSLFGKQNHLYPGR